MNENPRAIAYPLLEKVNEPQSREAASGESNLFIPKKFSKKMDKKSGCGRWMGEGNID